MAETTKNNPEKITFVRDNAENIRQVMAWYKNILVCGIKGAGKITSTVRAIQDKRNVFYIGNPVDYEGKRRPGSFEKYLQYITTLKQDITIVDDVSTLYRIKTPVILIIDEIFGRSDADLAQIRRLLDQPNIQIFQIVGCLKNMGTLIEKIDVVVELHHDGAFLIDKDLARAICRILGSKPERDT